MYRYLTGVVYNLNKIKIYTIDQSQGIDVEIVIISSVLSTPLMPLDKLSQSPSLPQLSSPNSQPITNPKHSNVHSTTLPDKPYQSFTTPNYQLLADWQRGNVALTRARNKFIMIGDLFTLTKGYIDPKSQHFDHLFQINPSSAIKNDDSTKMNDNTISEKLTRNNITDMVKELTQSVYAGAFTMMYQDRQTLHVGLDKLSFFLWHKLCFQK
jgi:hypothetical protein